jgi:hypothetical protein
VKTRLYRQLKAIRSGLDIFPGGADLVLVRGYQTVQLGVEQWANEHLLKERTTSQISRI